MGYVRELNSLTKITKYSYNVGKFQTFWGRYVVDMVFLWDIFLWYTYLLLRLKVEYLADGWYPQDMRAMHNEKNVLMIVILVIKPLSFGVL